MKRKEGRQSQQQEELEEINTSGSTSNTSNTQEITDKKEKKPKYHVYDLYSVKYALDTAVKNILLDNKGFNEDVVLSNIKLIIGFIACGGAVFAYFTKNTLLALGLCLFYLLVISLLSLNSYFFEKATTILAYSRQSGFIRVETDIIDDTNNNTENSNTNPNCPKYEIIIHYPKGSSLVSRYTTSNNTVSHSWYINELVDSYGTCDRKELSRAISELIKEKK
ncbi:hypothetical protein ABK040_013001 [Willaertia magna]